MIYVHPRANQTVDSGDIQTRPQLSFRKYKYNLYTIMIVDFGNALPTMYLDGNIISFVRS